MIFSVFRLLVLALFAAACVSKAEIHETRQSPAGDLLPGEAVAVVRLISSIGDGIAGCVGRSIRESGAGIKVVSSTKFREGMFPWFEPGTAPTTAEGLAKLMVRPAVKRRIGEFGVRYVVAVGGKISGGADGWGGGFASGQVGVFVGGVEFTNSTRLAAVILDLKQARPVGEVSASASGAGGVGLLFIIPYFVPAPDTEAITCNAIAKRVVGFLKGDPQPPDLKPGKKKP